MITKTKRDLNQVFVSQDEIAWYPSPLFVRTKEMRGDKTK
jgi:hypothetical protein